jgi:hypothetical protein
MKRIADILFWFQFVMAWAYTVPQVFRLFESTQGVTIIFFLSQMAFLVFNLSLAISACKNNPSREKKQTLMIYVNWTFLISVLFAIVLAKVAWKNSDWLVVLLTVAGTIIVVLIGSLGKLSYKDPIIRGFLSCLYKTVPQIYLGWCIWHDGGGAGLAAIMVWSGHLTALTRIAQIGVAIKRSGWDRNMAGIVLSESGNELSWIFATIMWLVFTR